MNPSMRTRREVEQIIDRLDEFFPREDQDDFAIVARRLIRLVWLHHATMRWGLQNGLCVVSGTDENGLTEYEPTRKGLTAKSTDFPLPDDFSVDLTLDDLVDEILLRLRASEKQRFNEIIAHLLEDNDTNEE